MEKKPELKAQRPQSARSTTWLTGRKESTRASRLAARAQSATVRRTEMDNVERNNSGVKKKRGKKIKIGGAMEMKDFAVHVSKELNEMMQGLGENDILSVINIVNESRMREQKVAMAQDPVIEELMELRGEDHGLCDIGQRNARFFYDKGFELRCRGDFHGAIRSFRKSTKMEPKDFKSWFNLGFLLDRTGSFAKAELAFRKSALLQPDIPIPHFNLGLVLTKQGKYDDAVRAFNQALALDTTRAEFHRARAYAHRRRVLHLDGSGSQLDGDFAAASRDYVSARSFEPTFLKAPSQPYSDEFLAVLDGTIPLRPSTVVKSQLDKEKKRTATISYAGLHPLFFESDELWQEPENIRVNVHPDVAAILNSKTLETLEPYQKIITRGHLAFGKYEAIGRIPPTQRTQKDISTLSNFTKGIKLLQGLSQNFHLHLCQNIGVQTFNDGEDVILPGQSISASYVVLRGQVEIFRGQPPPFVRSGSRVVEERNTSCQGESLTSSPAAQVVDGPSNSTTGGNGKFHIQRTAAAQKWPGDSFGDLKIDRVIANAEGLQQSNSQQSNEVHSIAARAIGNVSVLVLNRAEIADAAKYLKEQNTNERVEFLRKTTLFSILDEKSLKATALSVQEKCFTAGDRIVQEGDKLRGVIVIVSGSCSISRLCQQSQRPQKIAELGTKDVFGQQCLMTSVLHIKKSEDLSYRPPISESTLTASTVTKVYTISTQDLFSQTTYQGRAKMRDMIHSNRSCAVPSQTSHQAESWELYKTKLVDNIVRRSKELRQLSQSQFF